MLSTMEDCRTKCDKGHSGVTECTFRGRDVLSHWQWLQGRVELLKHFHVALITSICAPPRS